MTQRELQIHNKAVLESLEEGDLIEIKRRLFSHWAVYSGNEEVIHLTWDEEQASSTPKQVSSPSGALYKKAIVKIQNFWEVVSGSRAKKNNSKDENNSYYSPKEIVDRARRAIGQVNYNLLWYNCEHFASWCRYNSEMSDQVKRALFVTAGTVGTAATLYIGKKIYDVWITEPQKTSKL